MAKKYKKEVYNINTDKLTIGQEAKNYKTLCLLLDEDIKSGNAKKAHLKEMSYYFSYHKNGNKYIIDEVYQDVDIEEINRNKSFYYITIRKLLIYILAQEKGILNISKSKLFELLNMVNKNFSKYKSHYEPLSDKLNIHIKHINEFYFNTYSIYTSILSRVMNRMRNERIIDFQKQKMIAYQPADKLLFREATEKEIQLILDIEKDILKEMGYNDMSSMILSKKYSLFREKCIDKAYGKIEDMEFYFDTIKIWKVENSIQEEYNTILQEIKTINQYKSELNNKCADRLLLSTNTRHNSALEKYILNDDKLLQKYENYLPNMSMLVDELIRELIIK